MTQAPLRKLSSYTLPWPTDWDALFGAPRRLILEIGFGRGEFLLHLARQNPDAHIIGLEISNRCLLDMETRLAQGDLPNVRVIYATAETALHHLFQPATLSDIHINFPDPWFKKRHSHRRLMQPDTVNALISRLQPGAGLYLATDILEYAELTHALLSAAPALENQLPTPWAGTLPGRVSTKYERRAQREGRACYYFAYRRRAAAGPEVPVIKEWDMPHIVLHSPLPLEAMRAAFVPLAYDHADTHIQVREVFQGRRALLFDAYVREATIDQRVALVLVEREAPGEYTLQLSTIGQPRPTAGLHIATNLLGDWLIGLHPDTRILQRKTQSADDNP
jgi:tRNA (guanine-N7-)-methyltransferase